MHDYPATAKFLTPDERKEVSRRLEHDRSALDDEYDLKYFWHAVKDWKIWVHMLITIGSVDRFMLDSRLLTMQQYLYSTVLSLAVSTNNRQDSRLHQ